MGCGSSKPAVAEPSKCAWTAARPTAGAWPAACLDAAGWPGDGRPWSWAWRAGPATAPAAGAGGTPRSCSPSGPASRSPARTPGRRARAARRHAWLLPPRGTGPGSALSWAPAPQEAILAYSGDSRANLDAPVKRERRAAYGSEARPFDGCAALRPPTQHLSVHDKAATGTSTGPGPSWQPAHLQHSAGQGLLAWQRLCWCHQAMAAPCIVRQLRPGHTGICDSPCGSARQLGPAPVVAACHMRATLLLSPASLDERASSRACAHLPIAARAGRSGGPTRAHTARLPLAQRSNVHTRVGGARPAAAAPQRQGLHRQVWRPGRAGRSVRL